MASPKSDEIFRKQALDHLSSPEQLDQLLEVTTRKSWLAIAVLIGGLLVGVVWSIVGRIPITVEGRGVLIHPHKIVSFQSPALGPVVSWNVEVGDAVRKDHVLGRINQPELQQRLEQEKIRLTEFEKRELDLHTIRERRMSLEREWISKARRRINDRAGTILRTANEQKEKSEKYFANQDANLRRLDEDTQELGTAIKERFESVTLLQSQGNAQPLEVLEAQRDFFDNKVKLADIRLRLHGLELHRLNADAYHLQQMNTVANLQSDLQELDVQWSKIEQAQREAESKSDAGRQEIQRSIDRYEGRLKIKGRIVSEYDGEILEITGAVGQIVSVGQRLGRIELDALESELVAVVYYDTKDGKRITINMDTRVSPDTVERTRFGSMIGSVKSVSPFPVTTDAVTILVGDAELARGLTAGGSKIEVRSVLALDPLSGTEFVWTSGKGPKTPITAGTPILVRTMLEFRRPISYVIPLLRHGSGE